MDKSSIVAKRYAKALIAALAKESEGSALEAGLYEVSTAISAISLAVSSSQESVLFFKNPTVALHKKQKVMSALTKEVSSATILASFMRTVLDNGRSDCIKQIAEAVQNEIREHLGLVPVSVTTARALEPGQRETIEKLITSGAQHTFEFSWSVDPSAIGGIIVETKGRRFDASISGKLDALQKSVSI